MKLYYAPGGCSVGIHVLLEEIGIPHELQALSMQAGDTRKPAFLAINPKGKVPTLLRDDGSVLTEYGAIAHWLARCHPDAQLLPVDAQSEARMHEVLDFCVGGIHKEGFTRIFRPAYYSPRAEDHDTVRKQGREFIEQGFSLLGSALSQSERWVISSYSIADSALFYLELWSLHVGIALPDRLQTHLDNMLARPAVQRALRAEGQEIPPLRRPT
ncbi:glutathione S-transferase family protein [Hydrocarboniphaga sp.]|uniref:glutathione S-transferase family protein n=1 Tax=Hydrocarboniphaga sp. TaxID=2033016 RepID=UPI003D1224F5